MKFKLIIATLTLAASTASFGGDGGPSADLSVPQTLAEIHSGGGYPFFNDFTLIKVDVTGQVSWITKTSAGPVLTLSAESLARLVESVESTSETELVDLDAGKPECVDAPTITYTITKKNGQKVKVGRWMGCHDYELKNNDSYRVLPSLKAIKTLSGL